MVLDDRAQPESLDDILAAVKETPRGRWFLENFENRLRGNDTAKILGAIATLEKQILSMESSGAETGLLRRARAAIAQARKDIMNLPGRPPELSVEGQLFAKLAALSKQHFPQDSGTGHSVERALRLVTDLDEDLSAPARPGESKQFFKQGLKSLGMCRFAPLTYRPSSRRVRELRSIRRSALVSSARR